MKKIISGSSVFCSSTSSVLKNAVSQIATDIFNDDVIRSFVSSDALIVEDVKELLSQNKFITLNIYEDELRLEYDEDLDQLRFYTNHFIGRGSFKTVNLAFLVKKDGDNLNIDEGVFYTPNDERKLDDFKLDMKHQVNISKDDISVPILFEADNPIDHIFSKGKPVIGKPEYVVNDRKLHKSTSSTISYFSISDFLRIIKLCDLHQKKYGKLPADLKPENMVRLNGCLYLIDTHGQNFTISFANPEQMKFKEGMSDLSWSLTAIIMHELMGEVQCPLHLMLCSGDKERIDKVAYIFALGTYCLDTFNQLCQVLDTKENSFYDQFLDREFAADHPLKDIVREELKSIIKLGLHPEKLQRSSIRRMENFFDHCLLLKGAQDVPDIGDSKTFSDAVSNLLWHNCLELAEKMLASDPGYYTGTDSSDNSGRNTPECL